MSDKERENFLVKKKIEIITGLILITGLISGLTAIKLGLLTSARNSVCAVQNCHGFEVSCGPNAVQTCTAVYQIGDRCRDFVTCGKTEGLCRSLYSDKFISCKACVEKCIADFGKDPQKVFQCESQCGKD